MLSGQVKMTIKEAIEAMDSYLADFPPLLAIPSTHQIGESVWIELNTTKREFDQNDPHMSGRIKAIHFYPGNRVKYDLEIPVYDEESTRIYNIDSNFIFKKLA
jgi:hypothetical protein